MERKESSGRRVKNLRNNREELSPPTPCPPDAAGEGCPGIGSGWGQSMESTSSFPLSPMAFVREPPPQPSPGAGGGQGERMGTGQGSPAQVWDADGSHLARPLFHGQAPLDSIIPVSKW